MANKHVDLFKEIMPAVDLGLKDLWDAVEDEGRKEIEMIIQAQRDWVESN